MSTYFELEKRKLENKFATAGNKFMDKICQTAAEYQQELKELRDSYSEIAKEENAKKSPESTPELTPESTPETTPEQEKTTEEVVQEVVQETVEAKEV